MGHDKDQTTTTMQRDQGQSQSGQGEQTGTTGTMPRDTSQVGTHGDSAAWDRDKTQGDQTKPAQPSGTTPLERDQRPINQSR